MSVATTILYVTLNKTSNDILSFSIMVLTVCQLLAEVIRGGARFSSPFMSQYQVSFTELRNTISSGVVENTHAIKENSDSDFSRRIHT